jgi:serine/threonine-protein phosphatase 2B catalytic subunit
MEPLKDPLKDRYVNDIPLPPAKCLYSHLLFPTNLNIPDWEVLKNHFQKEGKISKQDACAIIKQTTKILSYEPNLLQISDPVVIIGDIHGQYYDLLKILELGGKFTEMNYLFLGDYVDRGAFSIEVLLLLYSIKLNFPSSVFLLRGNHECRHLTSYFNFRAECLYKYDLELYDLVMNSFDYLPLACLVNKRFLGLHGGISPNLVSISDIEQFNRVSEPARSGIFCDILWSDPLDVTPQSCKQKYLPNSVRGCGYYFGGSAVRKFLRKNKLFSIIRAHEAQLEGYKMNKWTGADKFPEVITVFSAPNYCDIYHNKGAIIKFIDGNLHIIQYNYSEHPYILPNFMNLFTWSVPFVVEKILQILHKVLGRKDLENKEQNLKKSKLDKFRNKVKAITKMIRIFKVLRQENTLILELKGLSPDHKIPLGILQQGREGIKNAIKNFNLAKTWDRINEKRPE